MDDLNTDAEHPVAKQLAAYNAKDIDAFMSCWTEDCRYFEFPGRLLASGAAAVRERHMERFKEPDLRARLVRRITAAGLVVDQETVTRSFPGGPAEVDVIAIYEVQAGRIARAWFKQGPPRPLPSVRISRATPADAQAVRDLTCAAYRKWIEAIGREPTPMTVDYTERIRDHLVELLLVDGRLAALVELVPEAEHLLVENLAVLPENQRRGYGSLLLAHAETIAASLGLSALRLYTNPLFAGNVRFYEGHGYQVDREEPFKGGTTVYMSKRLCLTEEAVDA